jgi:hypothetical protein
MITEETRRRASDVLFLIRRGPVRARLRELGNTRAFDADATAWRLLRPVAEEFRARHRPEVVAADRRARRRSRTGPPRVNRIERAAGPLNDSPVRVMIS